MEKAHEIVIAMLGESGVGKTTMLMRFLKDKFDAKTVITLIDAYNTTIKLRDALIRLKFYDTGGQERFRAIVRDYYRKAHGIVLVYDVTNMESFLALSSWLDEIRQFNENVEVIIVGNKSDMANKKVFRSTVESFAANEKMEYVETSALSGDNVEEAYRRLVIKVAEARGILPRSTPPDSSNIPPQDSQSVQNPDTSGNNNCLDIVPVTLEDNSELPPIVPLPEDILRLHVQPKKKKRKRTSSSWCLIL